MNTLLHRPTSSMCQETSTVSQHTLDKVFSGSCFRGQLSAQESMAKHSLWQTGGVAEFYYKPADRRDLVSFIKQIPITFPITWVGLGSNLLVRDGGVRGVVIDTSGVIDHAIRLNQYDVEFGVGMPCPKVARFCARLGLSGVEFLAGIPGTIGGALAMNAGAHGHEIWDYVLSALVLKRNGEEQHCAGADFSIAYRKVSHLAEKCFLSCRLRLQHSNQKDCEQTIKDILNWRTTHQPTGEANCGSVFKNPYGEYAARLIDACDLKGTRIGKAVVSNKHANFIINTGGASAEQIECLIEHIQKTILEHFHIQLETEVCIIGEREK